MTMPTLDQRIAEAREGSRELDAELAILAGFEKCKICNVVHYPPAYTTSIDAALALVEFVLPPHWVRLDLWADGERRASAAITPKPAPNFTIGATGYTLPLAICTALLKSLQPKASP